MHTPPKVWDGVLTRLRTSMPPLALEAWILPLSARMDEGSNELRLLAPGTFHEARIRGRYLHAIREALEQETGGTIGLRLSSESSLAAAPPVAEAKRSTEALTALGAAPSTAAPARKAAPFQPGLSRSFDTFVVGPENALAREASIALAHRRQSGISPLFLAGPSGVGKSHLARALAAEGSGLYVSAEAFTNAFTSALRRKDTEAFKRRFRDCQLLVIEDVQFLEGKNATQMELLYTLEQLTIAGRPVVLTGDRLPREMSGLQSRLASEMTRGLVAEIEPPERDLRRRILKAKASSGGVRVPEDCLDLLVDRAQGSVRDLEGVLIQLVASASLLSRRIDVPLTEAALRKITPAEAGPLRVDTVVERVASFFGLSPSELAGRSRRKAILVPRQIAVYLSHRYTNGTLTDIGRAVGRDLPAVKNAIQVVERAILEQAPLRYQVEALVERLGVPQRPALRIVQPRQAGQPSAHQERSGVLGS
ncbi:MAG: ATP-binding protein [Deltaproteobacteria bacterium]|nr:ATP-binding protein [Deltaproteobacteria bacterium]MBW2396284.1 ATP-binding protein [Deltaproteobacteria bacterium]